MATAAPPAAGPLDREARSYFLTACAMGFLLVAGFSFHLAAGRSSFSAPVVVHLHAVLFMS